MADPTLPSLAGYLAPAPASPSDFPGVGIDVPIPIQYGAGPPAPPQTQSQAQINYAGNMGQGNENMRQAGVNQALQAAQSGPGYAERIRDFFQGNGDTRAALAARDQAAKYYQSPEAVGFLNAHPQYLTHAQQDPVGFAGALQTHLNLANAAINHVQNTASQNAGPAPSADGNAALGLPAGNAAIGLPGARPGSPAANAALGLPTGFNRADPNHIAALANAHGLAPQQAHAMMNTSGYDLPSFLNATKGMTIGQFKTMMSLSRQQSPSELALGQYYSRALADRQKVSDQYPDSDKTKAADAARAAADLKLNQVLYGISVGARMGMGGPADTNQ